jgi:hypothetical protein
MQLCGDGRYEVARRAHFDTPDFERWCNFRAFGARAKGARLTIRAETMNIPVEVIAMFSIDLQRAAPKRLLVTMLVTTAVTVPLSAHCPGVRLKVSQMCAHNIVARAEAILNS